MKNRPLKIFIIAGEASGDILGAKIMRSFSDQNPSFPRLLRSKRAQSAGQAKRWESNQIKFAGIGGKNMQAAGLQSIFPMSDLSVMGFTAVLLRARTLLRRIRQTTAAILKFKPDIVLTIDSPGFAQAVVKKIKNRNIKCYHFVAPQVWAWRPRRAKKFAALFDRLYCFFDFEVPYFTKYGLPTIPVGHPIADGEIQKFNHGKHIGKNIVFLPGSRENEVKNLMPLFKQVADDFPNHQIVIPTADPVSKQVRAEILTWKTKPILTPAANRYAMFERASAAVAASGTISVELAITHTPAVIVYRASWLTYVLFRLLVKIKFVSLVNIITGREIYPEFLGSRASRKNVSRALKQILEPKNRAKMIKQLQEADGIWRRGDRPAADVLRDDLLKTIK